MKRWTFDSQGPDKPVNGRADNLYIRCRRTEESETLPLKGELTIPFTDAASFEFEGRPKGVFLEAYRRTGLTSVGGHAFTSDEG